MIAATESMAATAPARETIARDGTRPLHEDDGRASAPLVPADRDKLGERIGVGGMGEVVHAQDVQTGREFGTKRLPPNRPPPGALARFLREARIQGRLEHPAIPPVYELTQDADGEPFFAMRKLNGVTLAEALADK